MLAAVYAEFILCWLNGLLLFVRNSERFDSGASGGTQMSSAGARMIATFNPPPEDRKIINARGLSICDEMVDEVSTDPPFTLVAHV